MSDTTIYTKSAKGQKWHIKHSPLWTLCYQLCAHWETTDNAPEPGEICQQCQAINEAIRTGEGMPF